LVGEPPARSISSTTLSEHAKCSRYGRSLEVGFNELALPAMPVLKGHVHPVGLVLQTA
jgi:hypothetical protein